MAGAISGSGAGGARMTTGMEMVEMRSVRLDMSTKEM
jgi:hypothetical protein